MVLPATEIPPSGRKTSAKTMKQLRLSFETSMPTETAITNISNEKCDAVSTVHLAFVVLFHIKLLAVFN